MTALKYDDLMKKVTRTWLLFWCFLKDIMCTTLIRGFTQDSWRGALLPHPPRLFNVKNDAGQD